MRDVRIRLEEGDENRPKFWKLVGQLEGEGGEDEVQIAAVLEFARTEERCSQLSVSKDLLADCLGDRGLAGPSETVEPEDRRLVEILDP